jgi:hypothetical protein
VECLSLGLAGMAISDSAGLGGAAFQACAREDQMALPRRPRCSNVGWGGGAVE